MTASAVTGDPAAVGRSASPTRGQKADFIQEDMGGAPSNFQLSPVAPTPALQAATPGVLAAPPALAGQPMPGGQPLPGQLAPGQQPLSGQSPMPGQPPMPGVGGYGGIGAMGLGTMSPFMANTGMNPFRFAQGGGGFGGAATGGGGFGGVGGMNAPIMGQSPYAMNPYINAIRG